jgi:hypothetical protein
MVVAATETCRSWNDLVGASESIKWCIIIGNVLGNKSIEAHYLHQPVTRFQE